MKHPKIRVDVEPLTDARWRKVDDAVLSGIDAGPSMRPPAPAPAKRRWIAPAAAAVAIAAAVILYAKWPSPANVQNTQVARAPSHIETGNGRSFVQLGFAGLDVGPDSEVTTSGDEDHGVLVVLERGSVDCEVAPRKERPPFVVQSGNVRVTVVGTHFTVRRDASGTFVSVAHGIVDVAHDGTITHLAAGEAWPATIIPRASTSTPAPLPPPSVPGSASASLASAPSAPSAPSSASAPSAPSAPSSPSSAVRPAPSDKALYEKAASIERSDPEQARTLYLKLSDKGGPWAPPALFAAARLASERGQTSEAQRLSKQYLDRYPNGPNAEDARRLSGSR